MFRCAKQSRACAQLPALTGVRGLAALTVFTYHFWFDPPLLPWGSVNGPAAVSVFFALSGFLMRITNENCTMEHASCRRRFWLKRAARIMPLYWVALFAVFKFILPLDGWAAVDYAYDILTLFGLQVFIPLPDHHVWHLVSWSLSCEIIFYIMYPWLHRLLVLISRRARRVTVLSVLLAISILWTSVAIPIRSVVGCVTNDNKMLHLYQYFTIYFRLPEFLVAVFATELWLLYGKDKRVQSVSHAVLFGVGRFMIQAACFAVLLAVKLTEDYCAIFNYSVMAPLYTLFILSLASGTRFDPVARILSLTPFVDLGEISYGIYLFHSDVLNTYLRPWPLPYWVWLSFNVGFCAMLYRYFEQPVYNSVVRRFGVDKPCQCKQSKQQDSPDIGANSKSSSENESAPLIAIALSDETKPVVDDHEKLPDETSKSDDKPYQRL